MAAPSLSTSVRLRFVYRAWRYRWRVEAAEIAFVRQNVRTGQNCLDIGGHKGAFTYWLHRQVRPTGHVYTFEPQPELAQYLEKAKRTFRWDCVDIINAAVSDSAGECQLFRPSDAPTPGATVEPSSDAGCSLTVPMVSVDQYLDDIQSGPISFIKCDVEGHELSVFRGAESILNRDGPTLLFECEQRHHGERPISDVFDYLMSLGYSGHYFQDRRLRPLAEFDSAQKAHGEAGYAYNFVFVPQDRDIAGTV